MNFLENEISPLNRLTYQKVKFTKIHNYILHIYTKQSDSVQTMALKLITSNRIKMYVQFLFFWNYKLTNEPHKRIEWDGTVQIE